MLATIQVSEVIWVLVAIPGAYLWSLNAREAMAERRAVEWSEASLAERLYSRYQVDSTIIMLGIDIIFLLMGIMAMTAGPNPNSPFLIRYVFTSLTTIASAAITYKAYRWRQTNIAVRKALSSENR
jgi:hypothetical protein